MALKDKWKKAGKNIGGAFANFGKAVGTTAKVVVGKENNQNEDGSTKLKESWKKVGHGFGDAGKSLGQAAAGTAQKVFSDEEKNENEEKHSEDATENKEEVVEAEVVEEAK